jgi:hypothetical protein
MAELKLLVDRLDRALEAGQVESQVLAQGGGWNLSQTVQHCAQSIGYSVTGYPALKPAWLRATVGRVVKTVFLKRGTMKHSLDAPLEGAPPLDPTMPTGEAISRLKSSIDTFTAHSGPHRPHPVYGECTHEEYAKLHTMHLEEHLPGLT